MSHFTALVIGDDIEAALAPYHEFECTGVDDQYVQDIDKTDEARKTYDGQEDKSESFAEFVEGWYGSKPVAFGEEPDLEKDHKYGYMRLAEDGSVSKVVKRSNPSRKWDWYSVGGRWTGFFQMKPGATGEVGRPGLFTTPPKSGRADQARKGDIDFEAMRAEKAAEAGDLWDKARALTDGATWEAWGSVRGRLSIDAARDFYNNQPALVLLKAGDQDAFGWDIDDALAGTREAFVAAARDSACTTYAVVHKGEWSEKGEMGWFGMSHGDMDQAEWNRLFAALLDSLPDDALLTVVDCHI